MVTTSRVSATVFDVSAVVAGAGKTAGKAASAAVERVLLVILVLVSAKREIWKNDIK